MLNWIEQMAEDVVLFKKMFNICFSLRSTACPAHLLRLIKYESGEIISLMSPYPARSIINIANPI